MKLSKKEYYQRKMKLLLEHSTFGIPRFTKNNAVEQLKKPLVYVQMPAQTYTRNQVLAVMAHQNNMYIQHHVPAAEELALSWFDTNVTTNINGNDIKVGDLVTVKVGNHIAECTVVETDDGSFAIKGRSNFKWWWYRDSLQSYGGDGIILSIIHDYAHY